jgi:GDPmannose 4,6-dehydratase
MSKIALIVGGTGQFGFYLAKFLLKKNYKIYISTRSLNNIKLAKFSSFKNNNLSFVKINILKKKDIENKIRKISPHYIFYFAGQSSVFKSFFKKKETINSNFVGCKNFLDSIIKLKIDLKFFNASSSEIYGNNSHDLKINSKKNPVSPYAESKLKSFNITKKYRKIYKLKFYNGVIFNSESYLRPDYFLIPKICQAAITASEINNKKKILFKFGNINVSRDWGWCEEYVSIIWKYLQCPPQDFIVATGKTVQIKDLLNQAFNFFKLDWRNYVIIDKSLFRKKEIYSSKTSVVRMKRDINYIPKIGGLIIIKKLIKYYLTIK